ncbi:phospholipase [Candidatus Pacearchaeota archaeon]|nr:phospholipase [Candidatus Pacearchaeota archaeon]
MKKEVVSVSKRRVSLGILLFIIVLWALIAAINTFKPLPEGISYEGQIYSVSEDDLEFLYDITYQSSNGSKMHEQEIFSNVFSIIDNAQKFIVIDMFLFNTDYADQRDFIGLASLLQERLIEKKKENPGIQIYFITDEINNFYGSYESEEIKSLKEGGISVIITDLTKLRDSNPYYSSIWRTYIQWFGTEGSGTLKHPLGRTDKNVTIRSFLKLMNTKANHRKVIVADSNSSLASLVTSGNPHSASSYHSNIGFIVKGDFGDEIIKSERAVAKFSGFDIPELYMPEKFTITDNKKLRVQLLTEGKIKKNILSDLNSLGDGDSIDLAMFYLSDRDIVNALLSASERNASIRIILDSNKDAFAREKNGIPNRQVAFELTRKSSGKIQIRWYDTKGEQFHTKLLIIKKADGEVIIYGGSANYTRRNLADLNAETSLRIIADEDSRISDEVNSYFERIFGNKGANYTLDFEVYKDTSRFKQIIYRLQEFSGFSSF